MYRDLYVDSYCNNWPNFQKDPMREENYTCVISTFKAITHETFGCSQVSSRNETIDGVVHQHCPSVKSLVA